MTERLREGTAMTQAIPLIRAAGDPYELGRRHGSARAAALRAFLDDGLARLDRVLTPPVTLARLRPALTRYAAAIAAATPDLAAEIEGLADGAGIGPDEALLLQLRREIMGYRKVPAAGECTTYARLAGEPVLAQTVDLNCDLDDQVGVLEVAPTGKRRRALVLSFGGLLGYLGVNSDRLAIGLNLVLGGEWRPGVPPYLAIRHLLDHAGSVAEAVPILRDLPLASSRSLTLCDPTAVAQVEILDGELRVVEAAEAVHANHYLHPDFAPRDELNVFARNSSLRRLQAATAALADLPAAADVEDHLRVLATAPICVPDHGDSRRDRTVAAVVMLPARGELYVRPGDPSRSATVAFSLRGRPVGVPGGL
jgi:isopenicillin-N N-acyltransferase-like protein